VPCSVRAYSKRIKMLNAARKEARQPKLRGNPTRDSPDVQISKTLSYLLRHGAQKERLPIRPDGFVRVRDLVSRPPSARAAPA
jgi:RNA:NAD 2'-phosphotransferase (TPT1/KptA family)